MASETIKVEGMMCGGCVKSIENALIDQPGVTKISADLEAGTVTINFDAHIIQLTALEKAIEKAGFDVKV